MSEIYNASGAITINAEGALAAFDNLENKSKGFESNMSRTNQTTDNTGGHFTGFGNKVSNVAQKMGDTGKKMSLGFTVPLVALGKKIYDVGATFDSKMRRVQAVAGATTPQLKSLTDQAKDLGAKTIFSASQCADGMENLASAGLNTNQIMDALPGILDGAAASGEDLASMCEIATGAMNSFGLSAKDTGHISDVMTKSANDTNASVTSLGESLKYCGTPAHAAKQSFEEVTAALGVMANRQIMGSQAGTTLRGMFTRLANPSKQAAQAMKKVGFSAFDAHGKMLPLDQIIDRLTKSTKGLTDQQKQQFIAQVFGQEAMSGTMALMAEGGESIRKLTKGYKECNGEAKKTADTQNQGVKASIDNMKGSFDNLSISIIQNCTPSIIFFANKLGELADAFGKLSPGTQQFIAGSLAILAVVGPVLIGLSKLITSIKVITGLLVATPGKLKTAAGGIKNFAKNTKNANNLLGKFGSKAKSAIKSIVKFGATLIKGTAKGFLGFGKGLLNAGKSLGKFSLSLVKKGCKALKDFGKQLAIIAKDGLVKFGKALKDVAKTGVTKLGSGLKALWGILMANPIILVVALIAAIGVALVEAYKHCKWFRDGVNAVWDKIKSVFSGFVNFLKGAFTTDWTGSFGAFGNIINAFMHNVSSVWNAIKRIFGGVIDFIKGVFTGNWSEAWQGVVNIFGGIMDGLGAVLKAPLNAVIGMINAAISGINSISVDIPSWVPVVGGQHFGVNLPNINYLYTGAVFDEPTLLGNTVVGDKFKGQGKQKEYVLPEPMIRKVVGETVREEISKLTIVMDGREVAKCIGKHKDTMDIYNTYYSM